MDLNKIPVGKNAPWDINAVIEIPQGETNVKYEFDKDSGAIFVDRFLRAPMYYPANYGFIPHTLADDGDPLDVLVVGECAVIPGAVMRVRPIGVMIMEDEKGMDEKVVAVPVSSLNPFYDTVQDISELPPIICQQITHFFTHYKAFEKGKWVKIQGWKNASEAATIIEQTIKNASK
jgi:inorganic pyrophosphatase